MSTKRMTIVFRLTIILSIAIALLSLWKFEKFFSSVLCGQQCFLSYTSAYVAFFVLVLVLSYSVISGIVKTLID